MTRRLSGYKPTVRSYDVQVEVKDEYSGEVIPGAEVILNDSLQITDSGGMVYYTEVPQLIAYSASKENYYPYTERIGIINTDTTLRIPIAPYQYSVTFQLQDVRTHETFWGVNVYFDNINVVTDDDGSVNYLVPSGTYDYLIDKVSYENDSGSVSIDRDTTFIVYLTRTEAYMKFRLKEGTKPINKAFVSIGSDSIESNNLGISLFSEMPVNKEYSRKYVSD
jgi:hypothetical protein